MTATGFLYAKTTDLSIGGVQNTFASRETHAFHAGAQLIAARTRAR